MIVAVTGDRNYNDGFMLRAVLSGLVSEFGSIIVYHGGASGADTLANLWASDAGMPVKVFQADWKQHGRAAGPKRNQNMLNAALVDSTFDYDKVLVVAFKNGLDRTLESGGTEHMCLVARAAGVPVITIDRIEDDHLNHPRLAAYAS